MLQTVNIKNINLELKNLKTNKQVDNFAVPNTKKSVIEEYMTSENFWKEADKRIIKVCKQYGVL